MNDKLFVGFEVKDVSMVADLETILFEMKKIVIQQASISYANLVQRHIERLVDEIALNIVQRPERESILDAAANDVRSRIMYAEQRSQDTEYNLYVGAQVLSVTYNKKPTIILRIIAPNDMYVKKLKKINELIPLNIYRNDVQKGGSREKLWESIVTKYETDVPIVCNLLNYQQIKIDPMKFKYRSKEERASDIAKEKVMNQLLSQYACDNEIPPHKIMGYVFSALNRMPYEEIQFAVECEKEQLMKILPEITFDLIVKTGAINPSLPEVHKTDNKEVSYDVNECDIETPPESAQEVISDGGNEQSESLEQENTENVDTDN